LRVQVPLALPPCQTTQITLTISNATNTPAVANRPIRKSRSSRTVSLSGLAPVGAIPGRLTEIAICDGGQSGYAGRIGATDTSRPRAAGHDVQRERMAQLSAPHAKDHTACQAYFSEPSCKPFRWPLPPLTPRGFCHLRTRRSARSWKMTEPYRVPAAPVRPRSAPPAPMPRLVSSLFSLSFPLPAPEAPSWTPRMWLHFDAPGGSHW
jgi:hypothetical protein